MSGVLAFEQQPKESAKAFAAFSVYLSLGSERSLRAVGKQLGKSEGLMERWSSRYDWPARVQAHAAHLAVVEREATEAAARGKAAVWLARQEEARERDWALHEKSAAAVERGLKAFMEREKVYVSLADIARLLEVTSRLGRLASGLPTEHAELTGPEGGPIQIEFEVALRKIYGEPLPAEVPADGPVLEVEGKLVEKGMAGVGVSTNRTPSLTLPAVT